MKYICCICKKEFEEKKEIDSDFGYTCKNCLINEIKKTHNIIEDMNDEELKRVEEPTEEEKWNIYAILF